MQCSRCGYFNSDNVNTCIKCNSPLASSGVGGGAGRKTQALPNREQMNEILSKTSSDSGFDASKTISESGGGFSASKTISDKSNVSLGNKTVSDFADHAGNSSNQKQETFPCPECGYPHSGEAKFCPNCSHNLNANDSHPHKENHNETQSSMNDKPKKPRTPQKTVNIFSSPEKEINSSVKLTEIKGDRQTTISLSGKGNKIELNRESLAKEDNDAISSNVHAEIINFEGEWYLVNRTSAGTTFVAANTPKKISKGDIILIGNTIYEFEG